MSQYTKKELRVFTIKEEHELSLTLVDQFGVTQIVSRKAFEADYMEYDNDKDVHK